LSVYHNTNIKQIKTLIQNPKLKPKPIHMQINLNHKYPFLFSNIGKYGSNVSSTSPYSNINSIKKFAKKKRSQKNQKQIENTKQKKKNKKNKKKR